MSSQSSALDIPVPPAQPVRNGLRSLPREDRAAGFLLHAAALAGILLPIVGHLLAPWLVYICNRRKHPSLEAHWPAVRLDQLRWGLICAVGWIAVAFLGLPGLFLAMAVTLPWAILVVISASQAEDGQPVRRWWPGA